jgi:hypothetical protein
MSWPERVLTIFGVPAGESPAYYRDILLGLVFAFAAFIAIAKFVEPARDRVFWSCLGLAIVAFMFVRNKAGILLGFVMIVGVRLIFTWVTH